MRDYLYYKQRNICVDCKKEKVNDGKTRCLKCREKSKAYNNSDFIKAKKKLIYNELKAAGICVDCKKEKTEGGRVRCKPCAEKKNAYVREYNRKMYSME